jgi:hypothetical protein
LQRLCMAAGVQVFDGGKLVGGGHWLGKIGRLHWSGHYNFVIAPWD